MNKRRYLNAGIIFIIVFLLLISKVIVNTIDYPKIILVIITSIVVTFVMEHSITASIMKQYDNMKLINDSGVGMILTMSKMLLGMCVVIWWIDSEVDLMLLLQSCVSLVAIYMSDIYEIYVGDKYIRIRNKFIRLDNIRGFSQREMGNKKSIFGDKTEIAIETRDNKVYFITFMPIMKTSISKLKEIIGGEVIVDYSEYIE